MSSILKGVRVPEGIFADDLTTQMFSTRDKEVTSPMVMGTTGKFTSQLADGGVDFDKEGLRLGAGVTQTMEMNKLGTGWVGNLGADGKAISWDDTGVVTVGGWTADAKRFANGDDFVLDAFAQRIRIGTHENFGAGETKGILMGWDDGDWELLIGDKAGDKLSWNGATLNITGNIIADAGEIGTWNIGTTSLRSGASDAVGITMMTAADDFDFDAVIRVHDSTNDLVAAMGNYALGEYGLYGKTGNIGGFTLEEISGVQYITGGGYGVFRTGAGATLKDNGSAGVTIGEEQYGIQWLNDPNANHGLGWTEGQWAGYKLAAGLSSYRIVSNTAFRLYVASTSAIVTTTYSISGQTSINISGIDNTLTMTRGYYPDIEIKANVKDWHSGIAMTDAYITFSDPFLNGSYAAMSQYGIYMNSTSFESYAESKDGTQINLESAAIPEDRPYTDEVWSFKSYMSLQGTDNLTTRPMGVIKAELIVGDDASENIVPYGIFVSASHATSVYYETYSIWADKGIASFKDGIMIGTRATAQLPTSPVPPLGMIIYDSTADDFKGYTGAWVSMTGKGAIATTLDDLAGVVITTPIADNEVLAFDTTSNAWINQTLAEAGIQPADAGLTDIAGLAVTDGNFIVGNGSTWVVESGAAARTSMGLGAGDTVLFDRIGNWNTPVKRMHVQDSDNDLDPVAGNGLAGGLAGTGLLIQNMWTTTGNYANLDFRAYHADGRIALVNEGGDNGHFIFALDNNASPLEVLKIETSGITAPSATFGTPLAVASGGTGVASLPGYSVITTAANNVVTTNTPGGVQYEVFVADAGGVMSWSTSLHANITHTEWDAAYSHVSNDGSDHSFINQNVTTTGTPTFGSLTLGSPLPISSGGTGLTTIAEKGILYASALDTLSVFLPGDFKVFTTNADGEITSVSGTADQVLITDNSDPVPLFSSTLPKAVQNNITRLGIIGEDVQIDGNLGINISDPDTGIEVHSVATSTPSSGIHLSVGGSNAVGHGGLIQFDGSLSSTLRGFYNARIEGRRDAVDNGSTYMSFWSTDVSSSATALERMRLSKEGRLGINTTDPSEMLHVDGKGLFTQNVRVKTLSVNTGTFVGAVSSTSLTANQTYSLPNNSGTLALRTDLPGAGNGMYTDGLIPYVLDLGGPITQNTVFTDESNTYLFKFEGVDATFIKASNSASPVIKMARGTGTLTSAAYPLANNYLGVLGAAGYGPAELSMSASVIFQAAEDFSATEKGTKVHISTTPIGGALMAKVATFDSTGNVGIGVSSPDQDLHIRATQPVLRLDDSDASTATNTGTYIEFGSSLSSWNRHAYVGFGSTSSTIFHIVNEDGNQISLLSPNIYIDNNSKAEDTSVLIYNDADRLVDVELRTDAASAVLGFTFNNTENPDVGYFQYANGSFGITGGNVGVGTTTPTINMVGSYDYPSTVTALEVSGNTYGRLMAKGTSSAALDLIDSGAALNEKWLQMVNDGGVTKFRAYSDAGTTQTDNILTLDHATGYVGVGTATPIGLLEAAYADDNTSVVSYWGNMDRPHPLSRNSSTVGGSYASYDFRANSADARIALVYRGANNGDMQFVMDNSANPFAAMTIVNEGMVGIGNVTPTYRLDLATDANTSDEGLSSSVRFGMMNGTTGGDGHLMGPGLVWEPKYSGYTKKAAGIMAIGQGSYFRSGLAFYTNNASDSTTDWTERMFLDMDGRLGIGTTTTTLNQKLEVYGGNINIGGVTSAADTSLAGFTWNNQYMATSATSIAKIEARTGSAYSNSAMAFYTYNGTLNRGMTLNQDSYLGIGITDPTSMLHIKPPSGTGSHIEFEADTSTNSWHIGTDAGSNYFDFKFNSANMMIINNSGDVGIGANPSYRLHVVEPGAGVAAYITNSSSNDTVLKLNSSGDNVNLFLQTDHIYSDKAAFHLGNEASGYTYIRGSRVGIRSTNPLYDVQIDGEVHATGHFFNHGRLYTYGGTSFYSILDAGNNTANRQLLLPDADGTLATQEWANAQGWITEAEDNQTLSWVASTGIMTISGTGNSVDTGLGTSDTVVMNGGWTFNEDVVVETTKGITIGGLTLTSARVKGNSSNLHLDAGSGYTYLNYYDGEGVYFGNGATGNTGAWLSTGKVGIGRTTPAQALEVAGEGHKIVLTDAGDSYTNRVIIGHSNGNGGYIQTANDSAVITAMMRSYGDSYFTGGSVGIGIVVPTASLHIKGPWSSLLKIQEDSGTDKTTLFRSGTNYGGLWVGDGAEDEMLRWYHDASELMLVAGSFNLNGNGVINQGWSNFVDGGGFSNASATKIIAFPDEDKFQILSTSFEFGKKSNETIGRGLLFERMHNVTNGEGSARILWTENNDSAIPANNENYGMSWNYQGDTTAVFASGATLTGGNATWAFKMHNGTTNGVDVITGIRQNADVVFHGNVSANHASGYRLLNVAATTTVPTLVPNKQETDTGIGWASDTLHFIGGGASLGSISAGALTFNGSILNIGNGINADVKLLFHGQDGDSEIVFREDEDIMQFQNASGGYNFVGDLTAQKVTITGPADTLTLSSGAQNAGGLATSTLTTGWAGWRATNTSGASWIGIYAEGQTVAGTFLGFNTADSTRIYSNNASSLLIGTLSEAPVHLGTFNNPAITINTNQSTYYYQLATFQKDITMENGDLDIVAGGLKFGGTLLKAANLSDYANVAMINQDENISGLWKFINSLGQIRGYLNSTSAGWAIESHVGWATNVMGNAFYNGSADVYRITGRGAAKMYLYSDGDASGQGVRFYSAVQGTAGANVPWSIIGEFKQNGDLEVPNNMYMNGSDLVATRDWVTDQNYITEAEDNQTLSWNSATGELTISGTGNTVDLGLGSGDSPSFNALTIGTDIQTDTLKADDAVRANRVIIMNAAGVDKYEITYNEATGDLDTVKV